jgi:hypothetical protein
MSRPHLRGAGGGSRRERRRDAGHPHLDDLPRSGLRPAGDCRRLGGRLDRREQPDQQQGHRLHPQGPVQGPARQLPRRRPLPAPAIPTGCAVQCARLRLYAASSKPGRTLHALRLASAWTENQVSWASQLLTTGSPAATTSGLGYRKWNVTTHVQGMYEGPNHGFLIRDAVEGQGAEQQFHSQRRASTRRSSSSASSRPSRAESLRSVQAIERKMSRPAYCGPGRVPG